MTPAVLLVQVVVVLIVEVVVGLLNDLNFVAAISGDVGTYKFG